MGGISFDCVDQIGYEVGPTLILRLHVGPLSVDLFVHIDDLVITSYAPSEDVANQHYGNYPSQMFLDVHIILFLWFVVMYDFANRVRTY